MTALPMASAGRFSPLGPLGITPFQFSLDRLYFQNQVGFVAFLAAIEGTPKRRTQRKLHSFQVSS
jgi:hypothetical protein